MGLGMDANGNGKMGSRVLVCQRGARHRYAIPMLLEESGMLAALYTDSCAYSPAGRVSALLAGAGMRLQGASALANRKPGGVPRNKVFASDPAILNRVGGSGQSRRYIRWGLQGADVVYSMYGEEVGFLEWAKAQGTSLVVDVFVHPGTNRIIAAEERNVLGVEPDLVRMEREDAHSEQVFALADLLLCPSGWVADGVREFNPACASKIRIVPYGSSIEVAQAANEPKAGTVLFAGRDPLRKGLHHLAEAAHALKAQGMALDVRVAGVAAGDVDWMTHRESLNFLGHVPMRQMRQEYIHADVFVLPSLSEGQAGVVLEAMACGCPVVATRQSGVDFEDGCGITVPVGDPVALAEAIAGVVDDRDKRQVLAEGALAQAAEFSMEAWKHRLKEFVGELAGQ